MSARKLNEITKLELEVAVSSACCLFETLVNLIREQKYISDANYKNLESILDDLEIDTSHFDRQHLKDHWF